MKQNKNRPGKTSPLLTTCIHPSLNSWSKQFPHPNHKRPSAAHITTPFQKSPTQLMCTWVFWRGSSEQHCHVSVLHVKEASVFVQHAEVAVKRNSSRELSYLLAQFLCLGTVRNCPFDTKLKFSDSLAFKFNKSPLRPGHCLGLRALTTKSMF